MPLAITSYSNWAHQHFRLLRASCPVNQRPEGLAAAVESSGLQPDPEKVVQTKTEEPHKEPEDHE